MQKTIRSGNLKGFYIIDPNWTNKELEDLLKLITSSQEIEYAPFINISLLYN